MKKRQVLSSALSFFSRENAHAVSQYVLRNLPLLLTLVAFLCHGLGVYRLPYIDRLDAWIYDARLVAHAPRTLDPHVVIVDIDEPSLAAFGRWPWSRDTMANLVSKLTQEQNVAALGFDMVFAEPESSSTDLALAAALKEQPVVLGYYLTSDRAAHTTGTLPKPVMTLKELAGRDFQITAWSGYGANLSLLTDAAPQAGFINAISDEDGVVRSAPLLAEHQGQYYESLALALYRRYRANDGVLPQIAPHYAPSSAQLSYPYLDSLRLQTKNGSESIAVDNKVALLVPFRGKGGPNGGSFAYISAKDVLQGKLTVGQLRGRVVILGSSTPTMEDLRSTPMEATYPGVEVHANLVAGLIAGNSPNQPDYAKGFELLQLACLALLLGIILPRLTPALAVLTSALLCLGLWWLHRSLHYQFALVLPAASGLAMCLIGFVAHASYGYFQEGQRRKHLVRLFGNYVSPAWVRQMVRSQNDYSMQASNEVLTVMFCDMRGFTRLAGQMAPLALQALLNDIFNRLSSVIQKHGGTIDKYMGDCVMAFWGAPQPQTDHAARAVACAQELILTVHRFNRSKDAKTPEITMGIGINTGLMCVGDMGSNIRRSYTVIGDAVNLASRLEGLCKHYQVPVVVGSSTQLAADAQNTSPTPWIWRDLGSATIAGMTTPVQIYTL